MPETFLFLLLFLATKAAIYTCVENLKFALCCHYGLTLHLFIFVFFFSLIACFTLCRSGPPAAFHGTFNSSTFGGNLKRAGLECGINQCEIKEAFE